MSKKETIILGCNLATRSGKQKLLSLWPYLSVEEKIKILQEWKDDYVYNELLLLILEKDCEVVRYLAVKKTVLLEMQETNLILISIKLK